MQPLFASKSFTADITFDHVFQVFDSYNYFLGIILISRLKGS